MQRLWKRRRIHGGDDGGTNLTQSVVKNWQTHIVSTILKGECGSELPHNFSCNPKRVTFGFFVPPPLQIQGKQIQQIARYLNDHDVDWELTVNWSNEKSSVLLLIRIGGYQEDVKRTRDNMHERVRICNTTPETLEYTPSTFQDSVTRKEQDTLHGVETMLLTTLWRTGCLLTNEVREAKDVVLHHRTGDRYTSLVVCRRRITHEVFQAILKHDGVERLWVSWNPDKRHLTIHVRHRDMST